MESVEQPHACLFIQMIQVSGISYGYDQQMTGIYGVDVHKAANSVIVINHVSRRFARDYLTEYAIAE